MLVDTKKKKEKFLIIVGKPHKGKLDLFNSNEYSKCKLSKNMLEKFLEKSYPGKKFFIVHGDLGFRNKENFVYKSYKDVIKNAKKYFNIKDMDITWDVDSGKNFNKMVEMCHDNIDILYKSFKFV
jgi:hypothetical protein